MKKVVLPRAFAVLPFGLIALQAQQSFEYCAFEVAVTSITDKAVPNAAISVIETETKKEIAAGITDMRGVARICDVPAGLIDVRIGGHRCGAVTVSYLSKWWMKTRRVAVMYNNCSGDEWAVPSGCRYTIRSRDSSGNPIAGVRLNSREGRLKAKPSHVSDRYGRIFVLIRYGETLAGHLEKEGYKPVALMERCERGDGDKEPVFVLDRL